MDNPRDRRRAPWLPGGCRHAGYDLLAQLAQEGLSPRQMAERLGTTGSAIYSYMWRLGITMAELRGEETG